MPDEDQFAREAAGLARASLETQLIQASRDYEDALRGQDTNSAAYALQQYAAVKRDYDALSPQEHQSGQLSAAQRNFLSRRAAGGDVIDQKRLQDYHVAHQRAVAAGLQVDSPQYFAAISRYADTQGDGRQPPLDEREAARLCGISEQTYAENAARIRALKAAGQIE
jgi:hypothetical protein